jgi:hypothetical protein
MTPNQWIYTAALLLLLFNGIDMVQTGLLLRYADPSHEGNPIMASLISHLGLDQAMLVKLWLGAIAAALLPFMYLFIKPHPELLMSAPLILLPVIINNGLWMVRILLGFPI